MVRLRHAELRRLFGAAAELATVTKGDEVARTLYRETRTLVPADRFTYNEICVGEHGRMQVDCSVQEPCVLPPHSVEGFNLFIHEHPCIASIRRPSGKTVKVSDFTTMRQFRQLGLYQECFKPIGIERQMMIAFVAGEGRTVTVGFNRQGRDFSERERGALDLLSSHIVSAHRRARLLALMTAPCGEDLTAGAQKLRRLGLTTREAEVLVWLSEGKTNLEIGLILGMSRSTVKTHVEHIFFKLGCETRTAAARTALEVLHRRPTRPEF